MKVLPKDCLVDTDRNLFETVFENLLNFKLITN